MKTTRLTAYRRALRIELKEARIKAVVGVRQNSAERLAWPQMHISGIESGKIVPRLCTPSSIWFACSIAICYWSARNSCLRCRR